MNRAFIKIDKEGKILAFLSEGHAGYDDAGHDIVCAGASILTMTLAETVRAAQKNDYLDDVTVKLDPEDTEILCVAADDESFGELARVYSTIATGYALLSVNYPENVYFDYEIKA